jgi:hypothetical protein
MLSEDRPEVVHVDGIPWYEAPLPWRWHLCKAQTYGSTRIFFSVERCACGAIRLNKRYWVDKNSRKIVE